MPITSSSKLGFTLAGVLALTVLSAKADTFGSGANAFIIDFVNIGNPGNADDAGAGGGLYSTPFGGVGYAYRMGTYEIPQDAITKATNLGATNLGAGAWTGNQPAAGTTWYQMAAFVNWMNTSTGHQAAYQLDAAATALTLWTPAQAWQTAGENLYRHKDAYYFLPSEDEWYKAAYHKNDGVTANYWDYATGSNTIPVAVAGGTAAGTVVYNALRIGPAAVDSTGGLSPYGTRGQNGNAYEWLESAYDGSNDSPDEARSTRGAEWYASEFTLRSAWHFPDYPFAGAENFGFRVASVAVPEPTSAALLTSGLLLTLRRRRGASAASAMI